MRAHQAGLLYPASGEELAARVEVYGTALVRERVSEDEASEAVVRASSLTGEDKVRHLTPGHLLEIVLEIRSERREKASAQLQSGPCPNPNCELGWDHFTDARGDARVRACMQCRPMAASA